ncbi:MAG: thiamine-monophosphate kinase [Verrucomicrobiales bacterium]|nr:thiamine-monophosphate kinase [Verrucomicrobiales bacterium]MCP5557997.1 thiamine-monophosphate kinase [Verrucomicrobiaceae bacterium]
MKETLNDIGEDELIRRLMSGVVLDETVILGAGDDCAVVTGLPDGMHLVLKTDAMVGDVHFTMEMPADLVGRKAIARVISDFGAMGALPRHAMITLVAPGETPVAWLLDVYRGMIRIADEYGINLVGGETCRGNQLVISISMTGSVAASKNLKRSGACAGDLVVVTGQLGGSLRGRHLTFEPRATEGEWLAGNPAVHAMMDLSDGLAKDLPRMAAASGLEFVLDEAALPCAEGCDANQAWSDGEDYELLMAVDSADWPELSAAWGKAFPLLSLTMIGRFVEAGSGCRPALLGGGWDHFTAAGSTLKD